MNGIPVLNAEGLGIARAWENSLVELYKSGCRLKTEYDKLEDPPSIDASMLLVVRDPLSEPMIHLDFPGGFEDLQEYVMEVCEGIKDHLVRDPNDETDTRWEYTYHQRLFGYQVPTLDPIDQIEGICQRLAKTPYSRRAQAITWKVWEDSTCYDPACLQSLWCRITPEGDRDVLNMNVRIRSNDAYKAGFMNIFAWVMLQKLIAARISELGGKQIDVGRYAHMADSYHIYGSNLVEFEGRFLGAIAKRTFEQRTKRYKDVKDIMDKARPVILEKAQKMGRQRLSNNRRAQDSSWWGRKVMESVRHNGKTVRFHRVLDGHQFLRNRKGIVLLLGGEHDICPLCKQAFTLDNTSEIVLVISDRAGVPNRFLHVECTQDKTIEYVWNLIAEDWEAAQKYLHWFDRTCEEITQEIGEDNG